MKQLLLILLLLISGSYIVDLYAQGEVINPVFPYWKTRGNTGTDTATYFLGTIDNNYLTFRTNNVRRATFDLNGNFGIGTVYPAEKLHLFGAASTARIEGVGTGGNFIANTAAATDKLLWGNATGTVYGMPNGPAGTVLTISSTTSAPVWKSSDSLFWKLTGNTGINDPAAPVTYGTSTIAATENWMGTTDANDVVWGTNTVERMRLKQTTGMLGIGNAVPASLLDLNGDLALREGAAIVAANGNNGLTLTGEFSHYRITGPTTAFSILTIANGNNGQLLTLINGTNAVMSINNNNAANGIITGTGANLVSVIGTNNSVTLIYNATLARWVVTSYTGMVNGNDWHITGNTGITDPAVPATYGTSLIAANENWMGTTDANDVVWGTNNIERMRLKQTTGNVGIGLAAPLNKLTVQPSALATVGTASTYAFAINNITGTQDITLGSAASFAYMQSWNSKPLLLNSQGNFVGVNLTTAPIQNLDVNGRVNVTNGVIQRGTTQINVTNDLGLYSQVATNWIRIASNTAPIKFFTDQGGGNSSGTNSLMDVDNANGGGVAIGANTTGALNSSPDASAVLDLQSTTKGMFVPRMTTAQRDAIAVSAAREGLLIYNITTDCFEWFDTKATISGGAGFWNSLCQWCEDVYIYSANSNGNNFYAQAGSPSQAKKWCVYVNAGVTLGASTQSGTALNFGNLPGGSEVVLYNYGTIMGGGGNGAYGAQESDAICSGDGNAGDGGAGGDAIASSATVKVTVYNYGTVAGGGGGGGGGSGGCRSRGGGGGGGRGVPGGNAGAGATTGANRATGTFCTSCTNAGAGAANGTAGSAGANGLGGCSTGNSGSGCFITAYNGGCGGNGGNLGAAGGNGNGNTCGSFISSGGAFGLGGAAGRAINGNSGGCSITNISGGAYFGTVVP